MPNFMVLLIINNMDECDTILEAWEATGVGGITILESSGLGRIKNSSALSDLPLMPSISDFFKSPEHRHRTVFTVVDSQEMVDQLLQATESIVGDLESPNNGAFFVLPVVQVKGVRGGQERANKE